MELKKTRNFHIKVYKVSIKKKTNLLIKKLVNDIINRYWWDLFYSYLNLIAIEIIEFNFKCDYLTILSSYNGFENISKLI